MIIKFAIFCISFLLSFWIGEISSSDSGTSAEEGILDYTEKNWPLLCQTGLRQSPIDIPANFTFNKSDYIKILSSNYSLINSVGLGIFDNHKFYVQNMTNQGPLMVKKAGITYQYNLNDIHFHITSEHTVRGISTGLEMHLVHSKNNTYLNQTGVINDPDSVNTKLVIGIRFRADVTNNNTLFSQFNFDKLGPIKNLNINSYAEKGKSFFHYLGGLTTPTCDEIVNWVVMEAVESISPAQMSTVNKFISKMYPAGNARATKPLNGRTIYYKNFTEVIPVVREKSGAGLLKFDYFISAIIGILIILY